MKCCFRNANFKDICRYGKGDEGDAASGIQIGPLSFTIQQLYISVVSSLTIIPVTIVITFLFRRSSRDVPEKWVFTFFFTSFQYCSLQMVGEWGSHHITLMLCVGAQVQMFHGSYTHHHHYRWLCPGLGEITNCNCN